MQNSQEFMVSGGDSQSSSPPPDGRSARFKQWVRHVLGKPSLSGKAITLPPIRPTASDESQLTEPIRVKPTDTKNQPKVEAPILPPLEATTKDDSQPAAGIPNLPATKPSALTEAPLVDDASSLSLAKKTMDDEKQPVVQKQPVFSSKRRTYGILPEGSQTRRIREDTGTYLEQGVKTWTTAQTLRDILQNHLDANTDRFFNQLIFAVFDDENLARLSSSEGDHFDEFTYQLFLFKKGLGSMSAQAEQEMLDRLNSHLGHLPVRLRPILFDEKGKIKLDALKQAVEPITEQTPQIMYRVVDINGTEGEENVQWLTFDQLQEPQYAVPISGSTSNAGGFRYQIIGVKITDDGSGFDVKLSTYYKSTKRGKRHLRGKFGEGAKLCEAHLMRHGAFAKMRSRFEINATQPVHERLWQHTAHVGTEKTVEYKGVEVDLPPGQKSGSGSFTMILVDRADPQFQEEFRQNVDPRTQKGGLAGNCLDYSSSHYHYPMAERLEHSGKPVGVSLEADPHLQYVQGLRVEHNDNLLFSYDFLDNSILRGRDRNELQNVIKAQVMAFWAHADSPVLITELIKRVVSRAGSWDSPEANALVQILSRDRKSHYQREDSSASRTTDYALKAFPSAIGAHPGEKLVIMQDSEEYNNKSFITTLELYGYRIIRIKCGFSKTAIDNLNQTHEGTYRFYSLSSAKQEIREQNQELGPNDERVRLAQEIFQSAWQELEEMVRRSGLAITDFNIEPAPHCYETIDPAKEKVFDLEFDETTKQFRIIIRPDMLKRELEFIGGRPYWKRRIQVEALATYQRKEKFPDTNSLYHSSQDIALLILYKTLHAGLPDYDAVPANFDYVPQVIDMADAMRRFSSEQENMETALAGWQIYRQITRFNISMDELENMPGEVNRIPEPYKSAVRQIMHNRIVVEDGVVGYFQELSDTPKEYRFVKKRIDSLEPVGYVQEKPIYLLDKVLFMPEVLPEGSVIIDTDAYNRNAYVVYSGELYDFNDSSFGPYLYNSSPIVINRHGLSLSPYTYWGLDHSLSYFQGYMEKMKIERPERKEDKSMSFLEGTVRTPIDSSYGEDAWNDKIRVFQDIIQNHLDASPDRKIILRFEVLRQKQRVWINGSEITPTDIIVGFSVSDQGSGYPPNDLRMIGKSNKKSPFFAGKYGEGQKMVAAAAIRHGFELTFSSVVQHDGTPYRWQGSAGTVADEIYNSHGMPVPLNIVVFNVKSDPASTDDGYTSSTTIRIPDGVSPENHVWQEWMRTVDPREKNEFGDSGLSRYVLPLRENSGERVINMGHTRILLDRPGQIYENGLLITSEAQTTFGYDVPEVVKTRERNAYDEKKLRKYIANAIQTCTDPMYADALIQKFKERFFASGRQVESIQEIDLDLSKVDSYHFGQLVPALPHWKKAINTHLAGFMVHSEEGIQYKINSLISQLTYYPEKKDEIIQELAELYTALDGVRHVPQDYQIPVPGYDYDGWSRLFPNVEKYLKTLATQEVLVTPNVLQSLRRIVSAGSQTTTEMLTVMETNSEDYHLLASILTGKNPKDLGEEDLAKATAIVAEQAPMWTPNMLELRPERVFVSPLNAGYLGLSVKDRIGINEGMLVNEDLKIIASTVRHELLHKYGLRDYVPEFIMLLIESARSNLR